MEFYTWFGDPALKIWTDTPQLAPSKVAFSESKPTLPLLMPSFPDPANPDAWIPYILAEDSDVKIKIYNAVGQLVRTLNLGQQKAGRYITKSTAAHWNGKNEVGHRVSSGLYFYTLEVGKLRTTRKFVILK